MYEIIPSHYLNHSSLPPANEVWGKVIFTASKRSLQRLCFYTCLSGILFTGEGCLPHCMLGYTVGQVHPPEQVQPLACTPPAIIPPWSGRSPPGRYTPRQVPPFAQCMLGYGQQVGITHPTGMQSCFTFVCLCMEGGLCQGRSLSRGVSVQRVSVQGVSVKGCLCLGDLCPVGFRSSGSLSNGVFVRETPPYGKEWAVCILLECILVNFLFSRTKFQKLKSSIG